MKWSDFNLKDQWFEENDILFGQFMNIICKVAYVNQIEINAVSFNKIIFSSAESFIIY